MQGESEDLIFPLLLLFFVQVTKEVNFSNGSKVRCFPKLRHCFLSISDFLIIFEAFRVTKTCRKTAIVYNFPKTNRDCVQFLHLYHAKTVNIDIRLLWPLITRKKHSRT